eukprot:jgi/Psemu1/6928/gm1.6928_g
MSCSAELSTADTCVQGDDACKTCFDPGAFKDTFPGQAENYFRASLAFASPTDPEFCVEASWRICKKFYPLENGEAVHRSCEYGGCEIFDLEGTLDEEVEGTDDGGSSIIIIGGGAGGAVLIAILIVCLYLRRRRLAAVAGADDDDDEEKGKKKKAKKGKGDKKDDDKKKEKKKKEKSDGGESDDSDAKSKNKKKGKKKKKKKKEDSDDSSDSDSSSGKKKKKKKKKKKDYSDSESSSSSSDSDGYSRKKSRRRRRRYYDRSVAPRSTVEMIDRSCNGCNCRRSCMCPQTVPMPVPMPIQVHEYHTRGPRGSSSLDAFEDEQLDRVAKLARFEKKLNEKKLSSLKGVNEETTALLKKAKLKAKSMRKLAVSEIEQTERDRKALSKSVKKLEREKKAMAGKIAEMEERSQYEAQSLQQQQQIIGQSDNPDQNFLLQQQQMMNLDGNSEHNLIQLQQQQELQEFTAQYSIPDENFLLQQQQLQQSLEDILTNLYHEKESVDQQIAEMEVAQMEGNQSTYGLEELLHHQQNLQQQIYDMEQQLEQLLQTNHYLDPEQMVLLQNGQESFGLMYGCDMQNSIGMENLLMQQQQQQQHGSIYEMHQSGFGNGMDFGQQQHPDMTTMNADANNNNGERTFNNLVGMGQQQFGQNSTETGFMTHPPPVRVIDPSVGVEEDLSSVEGSFYNNAFRSASKARSSSKRRSSMSESSSRQSKVSSQSHSTGSASRSRTSRSSRSRNSGTGMDPGGMKASHNGKSNSNSSGHRRSTSSIDYTGSVNSRNRERSSPRNRTKR